MNCPACNHQLTPKVLGDISVDVCVKGCGGAWFDNFELKKFDEPHESLGEELLGYSAQIARQSDSEHRLQCPKCPGIKMRRFQFSPADKVEIDECGACAGVWLDAGELKLIRTRFSTEADRKAAALEILEKKISPMMEELAQTSDADRTRSERFANLFRFILPSYYIPGKQKWGAF